MPREGPSQRLLFVLGKGGVGKSTVCGALGLAASRAGSRVLAVEVGDASGLARVLQVTLAEPLQMKRSPLGPAVVRFEGAAALDEFLTRVLRLGAWVKGVVSHPLYRAFVQAAPGVKEIMTAGKIRAELMIERDGPRPRWDLLVVDAGGSGHALELLEAPVVMADTFAGGRVLRESRHIRDLYRDGRHTTVHVVTTPEAMPVAEAVASLARLRALGLPVGPIIANRCREPGPAGIDAALARLTLAAPDDPDGLIAAACHELAWVRLQESALGRLTESTGLPLLRLPRMASGQVSPADLEQLATRLQDLVR
jgi:anion-transporting  ArsA/GET3 family ATPase